MLPGPFNSCGMMDKTRRNSQGNRAMKEELTSIATSCLNGAHDGSLTFPDIVGRLAGAGFDGYLVSISGRRVLYFDRDGATHTEHFPR